MMSCLFWNHAAGMTVWVMVLLCGLEVVVLDLLTAKHVKRGDILVVRGTGVCVRVDDFSLGYDRNHQLCNIIFSVSTKERIVRDRKGDSVTRQYSYVALEIPSGNGR